jgi:Flp pilus assembly protein protease CpaA
VTYSAILVGLVWNGVGTFAGLMPNTSLWGHFSVTDSLGFIGLPASLFGGGVTFLLMLMAYSTGSAGGGDVKLAGVLGVFLGVPAALIVLMLSFVIAAGWVLLLTVYQGGWREVLWWRSPQVRKVSLPLGVFYALAFLLFVFYPTNVWVQL